MKQIATSWKILLVLTVFSTRVQVDYFGHIVSRFVFFTSIPPGNLISAHKSVPAAIYSFLRCRQPVEGIPFSSGLERTILYAISLDGDTDTIASMAGAIAGAYYGMEAVPKDWMQYCEGADHAVKQADSLYDIHCGQKWSTLDVDENSLYHFQIFNRVPEPADVTVV